MAFQPVRRQEAESAARFHLEVDNPATDSEGASASESSGDELLLKGPGMARGRIALITAVLGVAGLACLLGGVVLLSAPHGSARQTSTATALQRQMATLTTPGPHTDGNVSATIGAAAAAAAAQRLRPVAQDARPQPLAPSDASKECAVDEELYAGLCYRKCSLLTYGQNPIRTSSWTCCRSHPCGLLNQKGSVGHKILCNGFDISGEGSCPKVPGMPTCGQDEEQHLGACYKKCAILTQGAYPHRVAAATCCKTGGVGCLDIFRNVRTSDAFNVGAGEAKPPATAFLQVRQ